MKIKLLKEIDDKILARIDLDRSLAAARENMKDIFGDKWRIVYGALKSVFKIITEDLFVRFGLVVYENALDTIKNDVGRDQHGGNYAFRPNSLELTPFDI